MAKAKPPTSGKAVRAATMPSCAATPEEIELTGTAGETLVVDLPVRNDGQAPLPLPADGVATFRAAGTLARGIREGFVATPGDFAARLIALGKALESEPSMQVAYRVESDGETLTPGAATTARIRFEVPKSAASEQRWTARLPLFGAQLQTTLNIVARKGK